MKKASYLFTISTALTLLLLISCTSNDYNKEETTSTATETPVPDTAQTMMPTDTSNMNKANNTAATATTPAVKARKVKVTTVMMKTPEKTAPMNQDKQGYYSNVEVLPMYPGGQNALDNFILQHIEYPEAANENSVEGVVTVNFAVDEAGRVSNARIVGKPIGYGLEEEVLKAVNKMPTWTPGIIKGKNVKTYYTLPVNFKLEQ